MAKSKKPAKKAAGKSPAKKSAPAKKTASKKPQPKMKAKPAAKAAMPAAKAKSSAKATPAKNTRASVPSGAKAISTAKKFNSASMTPLDDRLLITVEAQPETTSGGIIIPGTVSVRPSRGTVVAAGRGRRSKKGKLRPLDVEVGDTVLFTEYAGTPIEVDGQELLILREEEVLGIVT